MFCSVYCLCVNVSCTAATGCQPNCSYIYIYIYLFLFIYHIISNLAVATEPDGVTSLASEHNCMPVPKHRAWQPTVFNAPNNIHPLTSKHTLLQTSCIIAWNFPSTAVFISIYYNATKCWTDSNWPVSIICCTALHGKLYCYYLAFENYFSRFAFA
jgi:hypothetical protein